MGGDDTIRWYAYGAGPTTQFGDQQDGEGGVTADMCPSLFVGIGRSGGD
jgi:hypothetical protein